MAGDLVNILADLKEKEALAMVQERLDAGEDPMAILDDARTAMEVVGKRFEENTYSSRTWCTAVKSSRRSPKSSSPCW